MPMASGLEFRLDEYSVGQTVNHLAFLLVASLANSTVTLTWLMMVENLEQPKAVCLASQKAANWEMRWDSP
jgi:hypothetical protein